jgi:ATPase subunit of ABC transporter with duplicated ATPase domains
MWSTLRPVQAGAGEAATGPFQHAHIYAERFERGQPFNRHRIPRVVAARLRRGAGRRADQLAGSLSGGELFRAALATLLLAEPPPQLLLLDEPTNSLDLASMRQLSGALRSYRGALIVASHDVPFLRGLGITRWLLLDGELTDIDPL